MRGLFKNLLTAGKKLFLNLVLSSGNDLANGETKGYCMKPGIEFAYMEVHKQRCDNRQSVSVRSIYRPRHYDNTPVILLNNARGPITSTRRADKLSV